MIKVYHQNARGHRFNVPTTQDAGEFTLVATVAATDLERAYMLTNHIDRPWWENEGVVKEVEEDVRSSSMGDMFILDGRAYGVDTFGFKDLGPAA